MKEIRCIFMGTPEIAATILKNMLDANIQVGLVVTQPDKKKGRKQTLVFSEVKEVAVAHNIDVFQPIRIKEDYQAILDYKPDLIVTCAYGQIVPKVILDCPTYGCVNLHGSILPKYRGGAPIQRAIWNGDKVSGMSLMKMAPKMDAGAVMAVKEVEILDSDNNSSIFKKMAIAASELLLEKFDEITSGNAVYVEQNEDEVTFAPVISKEEEHIDLNQSDIQMYNQVRALSYEPGAYVKVKGKKFKILSAEYKESVVDQPFTFVGLVDGKYGLSLRNGILLIKECQMEGKPLMAAKAFYNGQGRNLVGCIVE